MPLYSYACARCGSEATDFNTVANRHKGPECCGSQMSLQITATQVANVLGGGSFQGYRCPVTDQWVTSRRQRRNIMAEHNLIEAGDTTQRAKERRQRMLENTNGTGVAD